MKKKLLFLSLVVLFGFATSICLAKYSGGNGSESTPYRISNPYDMNDIGLNQEDWASHFVLTNDIDLAQFTAAQFNIIAPGKLPSFTGVFDGNGFTISNFTYNSPGTYAGIFHSVGHPFDPNGEIKNLGLIDPNVNAGEGGTLVASLGPGGTITNCYVQGGSVSGTGSVGGLAGANHRGTISNCYATGTVYGYEYTGGLVGWNDEGTISDCYVTGSVSGFNCTGGLVGYNRLMGPFELGKIENCHTTVTVSGGWMTGGLVGYNYSSHVTLMISYCSATGTVEGNERTGGLVGCNFDGTISDCYADVNVSSTGPDTGGLVGYNFFATISDCNAIGNVSGSADKTGGLVGYNDRGMIANCFTTGNVDGTSYVGGLIGEDASDSNISNCYTTGNISGTGDYIAGLIGKGPSEIFECYTTGSVSGGNYIGGLRGKGSSEISECYTTGSVSGGNYVGGLAGGGDTYMASISNCYSTGDVNGNDYTGGLAGFCGSVRNSYATGSVNGNDYTGGLVGYHQGRGTGPIANCYATGNVNGNYQTGGLVGSGSYVSNCYATGDVNGNNYAGGLAGRNYWGMVSNSYATGAVDGNDYTGGLVGYHQGGSYTKCFWDRDVNPDVNGIGNIPDPPDVIGETTENMQTESTFTSAGWDFVGETANGIEDIWKMCYDPDYPHLFWEQCPRPSLEMPMHFTPRMLNPKSKGKWVKAHFILLEGFSVEDVNTNSPARIIEPFTADSNYMDVFINKDDLVKIMAAFDRADFCSNGSAQGNVVVIAQLTNGQYFYGTDTIRIKTNNLEYLAVLTSYWLEAGCGAPDWCAGADLDQSSVVDFIDFALFDGCCLEFIKN